MLHLPSMPLTVSASQAQEIINIQLGSDGSSPLSSFEGIEDTTSYRYVFDST
jgi:hypothetical protein